MTDAFDAAEKAFRLFFVEKLRPEAERIGMRRKHFLKWSLLAAMGAFCVFLLLAHQFIPPQFESFGDHEFTYWPLLLLIPVTTAIVTFCLLYILLLRGVAIRFHDILIQRTKEFIDPAMTYRHERRAKEPELLHSFLFDDLSRPQTGRDCFLGQKGNLAVEIRAFRAGRKEGGNKSVAGGVYFSARREPKFPVLLIVLPSSTPADPREMAESGIPATGNLASIDIPEHGLRLITPSSDQDHARQALEAVFTPELLASCRRRNLEPRLSCVDGRIAAVLSGDREKPGWPDIFDGLDFELCREFCLEAVICMKMAERMERFMVSQNSD